MTLPAEPRSVLDYVAGAGWALAALPFAAVVVVQPDAALLALPATVFGTLAVLAIRLGLGKGGRASRILLGLGAAGALLAGGGLLAIEGGVDIFADLAKGARIFGGLLVLTGIATIAAWVDAARKRSAPVGSPSPSP